MFGVECFHVWVQSKGSAEMDTWGSRPHCWPGAWVEGGLEGTVVLVIYFHIYYSNDQVKPRSLQIQGLFPKNGKRRKIRGLQFPRSVLENSHIRVGKIGNKWSLRHWSSKLGVEGTGPGGQTDLLRVKRWLFQPSEKE